MSPIASGGSNRRGEADNRCPLNQGEQFFTTLMEIGCETEIVHYSNCSHLFIATGPPEYREDVLTRQLAWFRQYLGEER